MDFGFMITRLSISVLFFLFLVFLSCSSEELTPINNSDVEKKLNHLWDLYDAQISSNSDSALYYMQKVREFAEAKSEKNWMARAYWVIGDLHYDQGYIGESIYNYLEAAKLFKDLGELSSLANVYTSIGSIYVKVNDNKTAIDYFKQAQEIFFYEGKAIDRAKIYRNLSVSYNELKLYVEAEEMLSKGLKESLKLSDSSMVSKIYNTWGTLSLEKKNYVAARNFFDLAIGYSNNTKEGRWAKAAALNNIGESYLEEGFHKEAENYLNQALKLKETIKDPIFQQSTYNSLGKILIQQEKYFLAINLLQNNIDKLDLSVVDKATDEGLKLVQEALDKAAAEDPGFISSSILVQSFKAFNHQSLAYNHQERHLRNKLENISRQQAVQAAVERYAFNEQLKASEATQRKMRYAFLIPVFLLMAALVTIYMILRRNKHYKELYGKIEHVLNNSKALRHLK